MAPKYVKNEPAQQRYTYRPPTNEGKEKEWEKQSLERQRVERVEAQGGSPVAPPPKQPQKPVYSNPVGGVTPKPAAPAYSFQPEIPGENITYDKIKKPEYRYTPPVLPGANKVRDFLTSLGLRSDQAPVEKPVSKWETNANNYMQSLGTDNVNSKPFIDTVIAADMNNYMRQFTAKNPTATKMQQQEFEKLLQNELLEKYYNRVKDITIPSTPPASPKTPYVNPISVLPRTTYQAITQNELLKDLPKLPVSPPYNTVNTPAKETPDTSGSGTGSEYYPKGSIVTEPSYGQGGKVVVMPPKSGGYTAQELEAVGNRARTDEEYYQGFAYEGYYLAPNGKYYPINYQKAAYAISKGMTNPYQTWKYDGYSKDVDDFIRTFGVEELWRYDPNWKSAGLKYSNPTTSNTYNYSWNTSGGSGASGNLGNEPRGRGWYYNPAVNWNT